MGERVRVGFIGCGSIARQMQMRWYAALPERVEIVALADPDPAALRAAAQQTGVHATACHQDYDDLLARGDLDAVEVCTPNHLHAGPTIAALQAGLHVLCQKPMAATLAEAQAMIAAAQANDRLLGVLYMNRFAPLPLNLKRIVDLNLLGTPTAIRARTAHAGGLSAAVSPGQWRHRRSAFAGSFSLLATHYADVFRWLFGPARRVAAMGATLVCAMEGDDNFGALIEFANGRLGMLESCYHEQPGGNRVEVVGDRGTAIILADESALQLYARSGSHTGPEAAAYLASLGGDWDTWTTVPVGRLPTLSPYPNYGAHWLDCVRNGRQPVTDGHEGLASLEIIIAGYDSAATGQFIELRYQSVTR